VHDAKDQLTPGQLAGLYDKIKAGCGSDFTKTAEFIRRFTLWLFNIAMENHYFL
jgi:hypothetical protein